MQQLNLNKCSLDESSIYELSELLKSKYCKLKILNLNRNNLRDIPKLWKCIKKNNSLIKLYVNKSFINNNSINLINRAISCHLSLESLEIDKSNVKNSVLLIRVIKRTKVVLTMEEEKDKEKIIHNDH